MSKVVVDANVFVSAIFGGTPSKAVVRAFHDSTIVISPNVEMELLALPGKLARKLSPEQILEFKKLIRTLLIKAKTVNPAQRLEICRDRKDNAYLELCLAARADILITGDRDLSSIPARKLCACGLGDLKIITPAEFCRLP